MVRQRIDLLEIYQHTLRDIQVAKAFGDAHVADHRAADEGHLATVHGGGIQDLLHAVNVRGEGSDDDAAAGASELGFEHWADFAFCHGEARHFGVGGVRQEQVHAFLAQTREVAKVGDAAIKRQLVHLEVAGVQHGAGFGAQEHGQRVRDRVVHGDEFAFEVADLRDLAFHHDVGVGLDPVLCQLRFDEGQGQLRPIQRDVFAQAQQVRDCTDVVLVAVGEHNAHHIGQAVLDVREVRQDQIHARLVLLGEEHTAVDDQQFPVEFEDGHVSADFAQAAEGNNSHCPLLQPGRRLQACRVGLTY